MVHIIYEQEDILFNNQTDNEKENILNTNLRLENRRVKLGGNIIHNNYESKIYTHFNLSPCIFNEEIFDKDYDNFINSNKLHQQNQKNEQAYLKILENPSNKSLINEYCLNNIYDNKSNKKIIFSVTYLSDIPDINS